MELFGLTLARTRTLQQKQAGTLQTVDGRGGWWPLIRESWAGAWQHNDEITVANVTTHSAVFACVTLKADDIAKMRIRLVQEDADGIWHEVTSPAFSPVLRKPNHYQNRIQFFQSWVVSNELSGNTYVLKVRDSRRVVVGLYVLDPQRVRTLVAPNGDVFYELKRDDLSQLPQEAYTVPAAEIIHDRQHTLFHPLVGLSPIYACGLAAVQGLNIQHASTLLFQNGARPSGVLVAPGSISQANADAIKAYWETNFTGDNSGKVAVLGDGLKYEQMTMSAVDAQLVQQLGWTDQQICTAFRVPPFKINVGVPATGSVETLDQQYYSQGLQIKIESIELCLDEGLGLTEGDVAAQRYGVEFDVDDLIRMDTMTRVNAGANAVGAGLAAVNEARKKWLGWGRVTGGDSPMVQQQYYSLEALAERDQDKPFAKPSAATPPASPDRPDADENDADDADEDAEAKALVGELLLKGYAAGWYEPGASA